jgi:hypothetical protein
MTNPGHMADIDMSKFITDCSSLKPGCPTRTLRGGRNSYFDGRQNARYGSYERLNRVFWKREVIVLIQDCWIYRQAFFKITDLR